MIIIFVITIIIKIIIINKFQQTNIWLITYKK